MYYSNNNLLMKRLFFILLTFIVCFHGCKNEDLIQDENSAITRIAKSIEFAECLTPSPEPPAWIFTSTSSRSIKNRQRCIFNVFVHIVRSSSGIGFNKEIVSNSIISNLNQYYIDTDISFSLLGNSYIDSDTYNNISANNAESLFNASHYRRADALNIYILSSGNNFSAAGLAENIPSNACIINSTYYLTSSLPHEVGHNLGLYHTHHGTYHEDSSGIPEFVNGSNSAIAGDFITDTPADPNIWTSYISSCNYSITAKDAHGETYRPDATNLMCYAKKDCRSFYTSEQIKRMHEYISRYTILQGALKNLASISGPTHFCNTGIFTVDGDMQNISRIEWQFQERYYDLISETFIYSSQTYQGESLEIKNYGNQSSKYYEINATIYYQDGTYFQTKKLKATCNETSPHVGRMSWTCTNLSGYIDHHGPSGNYLELLVGDKVLFKALSYSAIVR